jgi:hypothetical protein
VIFGAAALTIAGVIGLGTTALVAEPAAQSTGNGTTRTVSGPGRAGDTMIRLLSWSGRTWMVLPNNAKGPEQVKLTNASDAVSVDSQGRLHLRIVKIHHTWRSVELRSLDPVTYGTYQMINETATANFADTAILGMFVYRPGASQAEGDEIDIENSRFPHYLKAPNNAQFAVQPYYSPDHEHPYEVKPSYVPLFQQFIWYPPANGGGEIQFQTRVGDTSHSPLLARWTYTGYNDPTFKNMYLYIDLWLNKGRPPVGGTHSAVLRSVTFTPLGD